MKIYPALDFLDGKVVRLKKGDFQQCDTYSDQPLQVIRNFEEQGSEYLHLVDLSGAKNPANKQKDAIAGLIRQTRLKIQLGGGIRSLEEVRGWLATGVDRIVLGSLIAEAPHIALEMVEEFGWERVTLAMDVTQDASGEWRPAVHGWQTVSQKSIQDVLGPLLNSKRKGTPRVLCTDISRDGMLTGPSLSLYRELLTRFPEVELQASGGIQGLQDLHALQVLGVGSAILGKALYEGRFSVREALLQC